MNALFLSANNSMHFAWYDDHTVSAGSISNHEEKRPPYRFEINPFKGKPLKIQDLLSISSNDSMHFAWYLERIPKGDPDYVLWVCAGPSDHLGAKRDWYASQLPRGADPENLLFITSNNALHFAWFKKREELWVGRGPSNHLGKKDVHRCLLPPDVKIEFILYLASNDNGHFAFLKNGTCLAGKSDHLEHARKRGVYDLEELKDTWKY